MLLINRFRIQDKSMAPTLREGDFVITLAYVFREPRKGDVIVFKHPKKNKFLVKRIAGITKEKEFIVLGGDRKYSEDSRSFGTIRKESIVGRVWIHLRNWRKQDGFNWIVLKKKGN